MKAVFLTLPYPPSLNLYYRNVGGKVLVSKAGREYRQDVAVAVMLAGRPQLAGRLAMLAVMRPPDNRRRDLDNTLKALLDALQHAGVYADDSQLDGISVYRGQVTEGGAVSLYLRPLADSALKTIHKGLELNP